MSSLPSVYLETTVISYLTGRRSRNLRVVAHQEITVDWWTRRRMRFELYVSGLVVHEAAAGDAEAAAQRLTTLNGIPRLELTDSASTLAANLVTEGAIPREAIEDALHVAVAAAHGMDYLLTWNCRHIANATMRNRITDVCASLRDLWVRSAGDLHARRVAGGLIMVVPNDHVDEDLQDEIIEEVRAVRRAHAAAFGFDVARIVADLRKKDNASGDRVVSLPPKQARHRRPAAGK